MNMQRYVQLYTTITLEGLYDILEMNAVHESWLDAGYFNSKDNE